MNFAPRKYQLNLRCQQMGQRFPINVQSLSASIGIKQIYIYIFFLIYIVFVNLFVYKIVNLVVEGHMQRGYDPLIQTFDAQLLQHFGPHLCWNLCIRFTTKAKGHDFGLGIESKASNQL
jgi:hypothetical protein